MRVTAEISLYPVGENAYLKIDNFLNNLKNFSDLEHEIGTMSTLISGEYDSVLNFLNSEIKNTFTDYPAVFNIKLSNCCEQCKV